MQKEMSIKELADRFKNLYGLGTNFANSLDADDRDLIELCCTFLSSGFHPSSAFSSETIDKIYKLTNVNFNNFITPDAVMPTSSQVDSFAENSPFDPEVNVPSNVACVFFSQGNNMSEHYEYANPVDMSVCSNSNVEGIHCFSSKYQNRCPLYKPDYSLMFTHFINESEKEFIYKVYKYRTTSGKMVFSIYNQNNILVNQLGYEVEVMAELPAGAIETEIISIINEVHATAYIDTNLEFETTYTSSNSTSFNSYISTLIS